MSGYEKGKIMDLVYLKQDHERQQTEKEKKRYQLLCSIHVHTGEIIKLQKKIEQEVIKRGV